MRTFTHFRGRGDGSFRMRPMNAMFSLIASFVLTILIVLLIALSSK